MAAFTDTREIEQIALKYAELVKNFYNVQGIYLYGSRVKGNYTEDSDIDIAVIAADFSGDLIDDMLSLMKLRRNVDKRIEPHPFLLEDFNENNPIAKEILETGIKIVIH